MSNDAAAPPEALAVAAPSSAALTAGAVLRNARESAGLHIGALAVALKVPVKKLEALESDRLELLPDAVFARALASSVCRTLKLDPDAVLRLLPGQATPRLQLDSRLGGASFDTPSMGWHLPLLSRLPRPVVITASLLLVAALALLFAPWLERLRPAPAAAKVSSGTGDATRTAVETTPTAPSTVAINVAPPAVPVAAIDAPANAAAVAPVAAQGASAAAAAPSDAAASTGLVEFKARGPSWVEVTDAAGTVQLRKTMASGEAAGASGPLPLSVTIGRADVTDVQVRGKSFDLAPVAKDNVARFQIK